MNYALSCVAVLIASSLGTTMAGARCAAKLAVNRPYVACIQGGTYYARCVPSGKSDSAGSTDIYRVGREKDERVTHFDWYSRDGLVLGWSPIAGEVAVVARPGEPADTPDKQIELSFYLGGKHLRSWTTADLQELGATVGGAMEAEPVTRRAEFQLGGWEQIDNSNEYVFSIQFAGGKKVSFDILTGGVYRPHKLSPEQAKALADEAARSKGIKLENYVLSTAQFDSRKDGWQLFYNHKPPGYPGGHFAVYVNDETKATRFIGGR
ncbi:MAG TPA: hypothetical protein P5205_07085 [Candidatus Paceibacterota bacterium]|nr:hypothetical protein [Verrucomicrobiota bacterium]HSA10122.1 hypothetical protein [Candidatus Paceibacterota bacterium]